MPLDAAEYPAVKMRLPTAKLPLTLCFIAAEPSPHEVERGSPLWGPGGSLFKGMLRSANIDLNACFFGHLSPGLEGVTPEQLGAHRVALFSTIASLGPTLIVPLGAAAVKFFSPSANLTAVRGSLFYYHRDGHRFTILPTFHPDEILKVWKNYIIGVGDLIRAASQISPEINYPKRSLLVSPTLAEVRDFCALPRLRKAGPLLSCDIETGWGQIRGLSFAPNEEEAIYIPFISLASVTRSYWKTLEEELEVWGIVKQVLESDLPKLGQNFAGYDVPWLLQKVGIRTMNVCHDLRLLHAALYPELPKSLQFMGLAYSDQGAWKHWAKGQHASRDATEKRDA